MKNIIKFIIIAASFLFIFSCRTEDNADFTDADASFKLYEPSVSSNVLYISMKDNPFTLVWDNNSASTKNYQVVFSKDENFSTYRVLGTTKENNFTTSIGYLNEALLKENFSPYNNTNAYFKIQELDANANVIGVSNKIGLLMTPYPIAGPIITSPKNGEVIALSPTNQSAIAKTITWSDYSNYGVNVKYLLEVRKKGTTTFRSLGDLIIPNPNLNNLKTVFDISSKDLNTAALNAGAIVNELTEMELRITSSSTSAGGTLTLVSTIESFKLTPYQVDYPDFYLVGGATAAGWSPSAAPKLLKKDNVSEIYTYLQPDEFRFLGQSDWNPINYSMDVAGIRDSYKYFKTVSSNITKGGGDENMKFTGTAGIYHVKINADFGVKSLTVEPSAGVWDIPNLYLVGTTNGWQAASAEQFNPVGNGVFEIVKELPVGSEFKFLAQQDWSGKEWGNIHSAGNTGYLGPNGDNNNIVVSNSTSATNFYTIRVDLKRGTYQLIPF